LTLVPQSRAHESRPRRVTFVVTGLTTGGAEMMLYKLVGALPADDFSPSVISLLDEGPVGKRIRELGIPVFALGLHGAWQLPRALTRLAMICREINPQVLVGWMYHGNLFATIAAATAAREAALVWSIRQSLYDLAAERPLTRVVIRAGARLSARPYAIIYNSNLAAQQHRSHGYRPLHEVLIPNGFDCDVFRPSPEARAALRARLHLPLATHLVGLVARYHPMKDHASFLEAARLLAAESEAHFVCAGAGVDNANPRLTAIIKEGGLTDRVHLLGEMPDVADLLAGLDVLCLSSSRGEGFPNVVGEAMACGVPCVVTDVGDSAMVVGDTGCVVPPGDPAALARACAGLLDEPAAAKTARSRAARDRVVNHFSLQAVAMQYAQLLNDAAGASGPTAERMRGE